MRRARWHGRIFWYLFLVIPGALVEKEGVVNATRLCARVRQEAVSLFPSSDNSPRNYTKQRLFSRTSTKCSCGNWRFLRLFKRIEEGFPEHTEDTKMAALCPEVYGPVQRMASDDATTLACGEARILTHQHITRTPTHTHTHAHTPYIHIHECL